MKLYFLFFLITLLAPGCAKDSQDSASLKSTQGSKASDQSPNSDCNMVYVKSYQSVHLIDNALSTPTLKIVKKGSDAIHQRAHYVEYKGKRYSHQHTTSQNSSVISELSLHHNLAQLKLLEALGDSTSKIQSLENGISFEIDIEKLKLTDENKKETSLRVSSKTDSSISLTEILSESEQKKRYEFELKSSHLLKDRKANKDIKKICAMNVVEVTHDLDLKTQTLKITSIVGITYAGDAKAFEADIASGKAVEVKPPTPKSELPALAPVCPNPPTEGQDTDC